MHVTAPLTRVYMCKQNAPLEGVTQRVYTRGESQGDTHSLYLSHLTGDTHLSPHGYTPHVHTPHLTQREVHSFSLLTGGEVHTSHFTLTLTG